MVAAPVGRQGKAGNIDQSQFLCGPGPIPGLSTGPCKTFWAQIGGSGIPHATSVDDRDHGPPAIGGGERLEQVLAYPDDLLMLLHQSQGPVVHGRGLVGETPRDLGE